MFSHVFIVIAVILNVQGFSFNLEELALSSNLTKCKLSLKMIDSSGKIPSGFLKGNFLDLGNFDECLAIEDYNDKTEETTIGKYCLLKLGLPTGGQSNSTFGVLEKNLEATNADERFMLQPLSNDGSLGLFLGWCVPRECPIDQLAEVLNDAIQLVAPDMSFKPLGNGFCQTKDDLVIEYTTNDILIITFFAITLLLIVLSTIYDFYVGYYEKKPAHVILTAFSVKTNGKKLLAVSSQSNQLSCLHGIRFISMMWVILGHRYQTFLMGPNMNFLDLKDLYDAPINQYIMNAPLSVDTFFVLSGLLVSYVFCLAMEKGVKFNIFKYYLHRYLRLTPLLAVVVWFHATLITYVGSGPLWFTSDYNKMYCTTNWWATLLYIQNYYKPIELCISQSWYLAVDMQLYILSPLLLIPLWKWPKWTIAACSVLLFGSMVISFVVTYIGDIPGSIVAQSADSNESYLSDYYFPVYTRYGTWLMGFKLGYYLFKLKKDKIILSPVKVILGWIVGLGLLLTTLFSGYDIVHETTTLQNAFFNAGHRHGWALGICWVIFACTQGYGGPINDFLSWSVFQVLGRFTYAMYLTHYSIMYLMISASRTNTYFRQFDMMYRFWGDFMLNLALGVCLTLAYESPMMTIEKVIFGKDTKTKPDPPESTIEEGQTMKKA